VRRLVAALVCGSLLAAAPASHGQTPDPVRRAARPALKVTAFQQENDKPHLIDRSRNALTTVDVAAQLLSARGHRLLPDARLDIQRRRAQQDGLRAELLLSNYSNHTGDFSEETAHRMLHRRASRRRVAAQAIAQVTQGGWDGISVDFERLEARDAAAYAKFLRLIAAGLPAGASLSVCVSASPSLKAYAARGYDMAAIGRASSRVILMTYDEHGPWEKTPGPIGSLDWQERSVRAVGHAIPRDELDLGVAGYGYIWGSTRVGALSDARARALAGGRARFDRASGEWTATRPDGSVLWWSDARSYRLRARLAAALGMHGLAVWALGKSDPISRGGS
jgi:spore germination protein